MRCGVTALQQVRHRIGDPFDQTEHGRATAQAHDEDRQEREHNLACGIGEQVHDAEADHHLGQGARRRRWVHARTRSAPARPCRRHALPLVEAFAALSWASFSPDGKRILTTAIDGTAHLWDLDGDELLVMRASRRALRCGAWSHDGKHIVTDADDGILRGWPVDRAKVLDLARQRDTRALGPEERARIDPLTR